MARKSAGLIVGMSPDRLAATSTEELRDRPAEAGARLVHTPHAAEKIAAVLEGRAATVSLPSGKSPTWHAWDLAAGSALAHASQLPLATLDGDPVHVGGCQTTFATPWLCAVDDAVWHRPRRERVAGSSADVCGGLRHEAVSGGHVQQCLQTSSRRADTKTAKPPPAQQP
jgi:hypothetical protein